ncbi:protein sorting system archaetidylserine decarboxylase [Natronococcus sp. A-GB1]|uniref:protein sorting system archaetidylserine decarboxylase n=1 Tax=Natronococcus sp. A-GB1 TaxID=3037648 RepID=UPI00241F11CD|nr:protein sorting system archaetidylserine decarboxylase [Natronococcus sp. A-GB1]MDG5759776.1 protein sorting system archaetidylserine decarboxylase [Natronococcus sp. A-GB1]
MNFAPGAWKYALPPLLAAPFALLFSVAASVAALLAGVATLAFFRDPDRNPPPTGVVAPADGTVSVLREEEGHVRLGIFMNVWHVHVVRTPFEGRVIDVEHVSGAHRPAFSKESERNERVHVEFETDSPHLPDLEVADDTDSSIDRNAAASTVTLIAGAFARRIFPYVEPDDDLGRGQRLGHIAFGSRVDLVFPPGVNREDITVEPGDSTTAGETVVVEPAEDALLDTGLESSEYESDDGDAAAAPP